MLEKEAFFDRSSGADSSTSPDIFCCGSGTEDERPHRPHNSSSTKQYEDAIPLACVSWLCNVGSTSPGGATPLLVPVQSTDRPRLHPGFCQMMSKRVSKLSLNLPPYKAFGYE